MDVLTWLLGSKHRTFLSVRRVVRIYRSSMPKITDERRVQKFISQADRALDTELLDLWSLEHPGKKFDISVDKETRAVRIEYPTVSPDVADSTIARMRPFLMSREDIHVPKVIASVKRLAAENELVITTMDYSLGHFRDTIDDKGHFKGTYVESGSGHVGSEIHLWSDGQLATNYVYGKLIHTDENRIIELQEHGMDEEAYQATLRHVHEFLRLIYWLRLRVVQLVEMGLLPEGIVSKE